MKTPLPDVTAIFSAFILMLCIQTSQAGSATWKRHPRSGDWNTKTNWTPVTVPNGPADTATFGLSNTTAISISANTELNGITFTAAATNPYTITANPTFTLTLSGAGIVNNSGPLRTSLRPLMPPCALERSYSPMAPRRGAMYRSSTVTAQSTSSTRPLLEARLLMI